MISWSKFAKVGRSLDLLKQLSRALANGPYLWQGIQFYENTGFFDFCDALEGVNANSTSIPGASGVGLDTALANYANWMQTEFIPGYCESFGTSYANSRVPGFVSSSLISLQGTQISMAQTMLNVSTHITHQTLFILTSVLIILTTANGTGFCAADLDGTSHSFSDFRILTLYPFLGGKMEHLMDKKPWSLG
jgi:hypothetical protein